MAGISQFRNCKKHNSLLQVVLELPCIAHIHKKTGKRLSALFLLSDVRNEDK
jgi:hypothetical protein